MSISISVFLSGIIKCLSLARGAKQVRIVLNSVLSLGTVVLLPIAPVTIAVCNPYLLVSMLLTWLYKYSTVSAKAEKMIIFLFAFNGPSSPFKSKMPQILACLFFVMGVLSDRERSFSHHLPLTFGDPL